MVTSAPLATSLVSPALAQLNKALANFQCSLNVETRFDIESRIAARSYNLGIISLPIENAILDLAIEPFLRSRIEVMLPGSHPLAAKSTLSIEDISREAFVSLKPRQRWRARLDDILGTTGSQVKIPFETSSTVATMQMIRDGLGITLIDRATARLTTKDDVVLRPLEEEHWITYASLYAPGPRSPLSTRFQEAVLAHIESLRKSDPVAADSLQII